MQEDGDVDGSTAASRERRDSDVSALTGLGLIVHIASLVMMRFLHIDVVATVVAFLAVTLFGAAVVVAIRRRLLRALLLPLLLFVLAALRMVVTLA